VGTDDAGRRQYLYHPAWRTRRDREKFEHMLVFAQALPAIRRTCAKRLARPELDRDRALACAVRLLDLGFFRIGTEGYAEQHQHYGLATIRKEHVRVEGEVITFDYVAKSGKRRVQSVVDPAVYDVVSRLKRRRGGGPELLAYKVGGAWRDVKSADINEYIKEITGADFTAKDFRTWNATVLAAVALAVSAEAARSATARKRAVARAMKEVAHYLGNTPAVCRSSYVDPRVVDHFEAGITIAPALGKLGEGAIFGQLAFQGAIEKAVLDLLAEEPAGTVRAA
jgi:DNA topoisomerase IB